MFNQSFRAHPELTLRLDTRHLPTIHIINQRLTTVLRDSRLSTLAPAIRLCAGVLFATHQERRYTNVMVQHRTFATGESTCNDRIWHTDGRFAPQHPAHYAMLNIGEDAIRTAFYHHRIDAPLPTGPFANHTDKNAFFRTVFPHPLDDDSVGTPIPNGVPVTYGEDQFHIGRQAQHPTTRLLIRVMTSDVIKHAPATPNLYNINMTEPNVSAPMC